METPTTPTTPSQSTNMGSRPPNQPIPMIGAYAVNYKLENTCLIDLLITFTKAVTGNAFHS